MSRDPETEVAELRATVDRQQQEIARLTATVQELQGEVKRERDAHYQTVGERDGAQEAADDLAYAIAPVDVIGEHSNMNDPWGNAVTALQVERDQHIEALGRMQMSFSVEEQRADAAEATLAVAQQEIATLTEQYSLERAMNQDVRALLNLAEHARDEAAHERDILQDQIDHHYIPRVVEAEGRFDAETGRLGNRLGEARSALAALTGRIREMEQRAKWRALTSKQADEIEAEMRQLEADPATTVAQMRLFMQHPMPCGHAAGNLMTCPTPPFGCVTPHRHAKSTASVMPADAKADSK